MRAIQNQTLVDDASAFVVLYQALRVRLWGCSCFLSMPHAKREARGSSATHYFIFNKFWEMIVVFIWMFLPLLLLLLLHLLPFSIFNKKYSNEWFLLKKCAVALIRTIQLWNVYSIRVCVSSPIKLSEKYECAAVLCQRPILKKEVRLVLLITKILISISSEKWCCVCALLYFFFLLFLLRISISRVLKK